MNSIEKKSNVDIEAMCRMCHHKLDADKSVDIFKTENDLTIATQIMVYGGIYDVCVHVHTTKRQLIHFNSIFRFRFISFRCRQRIQCRKNCAWNVGFTWRNRIWFECGAKIWTRKRVNIFVLQMQDMVSYYIYLFCIVCIVLKIENYFLKSMIFDSKPSV